MIRSSAFFVGSLLTVAASGTLFLACRDSEDAAPAGDASIGDEGSVSNADASTEEASVLTYDATVAKLETGSGFALVYSADQNVGIDGRPNASATFDAKGFLIGYNASDNERLDLASATQNGAGTDGTMSWGAWTGGPTSGVFYSGHPKGDFTFVQGFHYAIGKATFKTNVPTTGTANYVLSGASLAASSNTADVGSVSAVSVTVDFASAKVAVEISGTIGGTSFGINTPGGLADPSMSDAKISSTGDFATISGSPTGYSLRAYFVGDNLGGIVLAYSANRGGGEVIRGAAALKKK